MSLAVSPACSIRKRIASIVSGRSNRKYCASYVEPGRTRRLGDRLPASRSRDLRGEHRSHFQDAP
jgi:hypothetical protein